MAAEEAAKEPRKKKKTPGEDGVWHAPGFGAALEEALLPIIPQEKEYSMEELSQNVGKKILNAAKKLANDERSNQRGSSTTAQVVISEFVDKALGAVSTSLYDRPWLIEVNFVPPLMSALTYCFTGAKIFNRVVFPMVEKYLEQAVAHWREEVRIEKAIWECVEQTGMKDSFKKKANDKLNSSYDDAHIKAPYGTNAAETPEVGMLQDFVKGWMFEFVHRAHDVLTYGISGDGSSKSEKDEQVLFVTVLFQNLCDAKNVCLPNDLTSLVAAPPAHPWAFVAECAETVFNEVETARAEEREKKGNGKGGGGKGKGKWDKGGDWGWEMFMDPWTMMAMKGAMKGGPYGKGYGKGKWDKGW